MNSPISTASLRAADPGTYRLWRGALRAWFGLYFYRIRVLQTDRLPHSGPALLVVSHPGSFIDALILSAALDRKIRCLLEGSLMRRPVRRLWSKGLGFIESGTERETWLSAIQSSCEVLKGGGVVLAFAGGQEEGGWVPAGFARAAATIAIEASATSPGVSSLPVHPVHLHLPVSPSQSGELLVHVDSPLYAPNGAMNLLHPAENAGPRPHVALVEEEDKEGFANRESEIRAFDLELERACKQNPFRLQSGRVEEFLNRIEKVFREDFEESWVQRPNSKQKVEDFELSPFLVKVVKELNTRHTGRLVALWESLSNYEERRRQLALSMLRAETAGPWYGSRLRRLAAWVETVAGFPLAAYGLLNLLPAWFILRIAKSFRQGFWDAPPKVWMVRTIVALASYGIQILLAAIFITRREAGYYAPSLPVSGAYLLRYLWLLRYRTRVLTSTLSRDGRLQYLRQMRKKLIAEIDRDQERFGTL